MVSMKFFELYAIAGSAITISLIIPVLFCRGKLKGAFLALQLSSLLLQIFSATAVHTDRGKPHYKLGNCYQTVPTSRYDRPSSVVLLEKDDKEYVFAYYIEDSNEFVITEGRPDHMKFSSLESVYPKSIDCPNNAQFYIIRR